MSTYLDVEVSTILNSILTNSFNDFRLQNCGLTHSSLMKLIGFINADNSPILNLFIDWNPCYTDDFKVNHPGTLWQAIEEEDANPWAKL